MPISIITGEHTYELSIELTGSFITSQNRKAMISSVSLTAGATADSEGIVIPISDRRTTRYIKETITNSSSTSKNYLFFVFYSDYVESEDDTLSITITDITETRIEKVESRITDIATTFQENVDEINNLIRFTKLHTFSDTFTSNAIRSLGYTLKANTTYKIVFTTSNINAGTIASVGFHNTLQTSTGFEVCFSNPTKNTTVVANFTPTKNLSYSVVIFNSGSDYIGADFTFEIYSLEGCNERLAFIENVLGGNIDTNNIKDGAITIDKVDFINVGKNLFDESNTANKLGYYLLPSGGYATNSNYNSSYSIPIEIGKTYSLYHPTTIEWVALYDENKTLIADTYQRIQRKSYVFENTSASYIRFTIPSRYAWYGVTILEEGSSYSGYEPYRKTIDSDLINVGDLDFATKQKIWFHLPKNIYVAVGRTIELYYNQVVLNAERYNIQIVCSVGYPMERKWQCTGEASKIGNYQMTFNVRDDNDDVIATAISTVRIVQLNLSAEKNVCCIGDSLTNQKMWVNKLKTLSSNMLIPVGTRRYGNHEGRSGANCNNVYNKLDGSEVYNFDYHYTGIGSDAAVFDTNTPYSVGDYCKVKVGTTDNYKYYVFLNAHQGEWNSSDVYCISSGNPFYDYINGGFSFTFYEQNILGKTVDAIVIFLGTNGDTAAQLKTFVDNIRVTKPNTPIILINTLFRSNQNGIAIQGNTDGYSASSTYKFKEDTKIINLANSLDETFASYENLYICPVGFTHDSAYNYGVTKVQVNPYISDTTNVFEIQPTESIHPQTAGYEQIGDEVFSTLSYIFNS